MNQMTRVQCTHCFSSTRMGQDRRIIAINTYLLILNQPLPKNSMLTMDSITFKHLKCHYCQGMILNPIRLDKFPDPRNSLSVAICTSSGRLLEADCSPLPQPVKDKYGPSNKTTRFYYNHKIKKIT